jgi:hypothetical protein
MKSRVAALGSTDAVVEGEYGESGELITYVLVLSEGGQARRYPLCIYYYDRKPLFLGSYLIA